MPKATREGLKSWVLEGLNANGGCASVPAIAKYIWDNYESDLRSSGDLFYTWQYAMRWAGQILQKEGKILKNGPGRSWKLKT